MPDAFTASAIVNVIGVIFCVPTRLAWTYANVAVDHLCGQKKRVKISVSAFPAYLSCRFLGRPLAKFPATTRRACSFPTCSNPGKSLMIFAAASRATPFSCRSIILSLISSSDGMRGGCVSAASFSIADGASLGAGVSAGSISSMSSRRNCTPNACH